MPPSSSEAHTVEPLIVNLAWLGSCIVLTHYFILMAYNIRLIAIRDFGTVIHEFDPYFNYRATEVCSCRFYTHNFFLVARIEWNILSIITLKC